jgi:hypothetical protein
LKQRCVVSIAELYLYRGINWGEVKGKLEGAPMDVDVATIITRAELVPVVNTFILTEESPSPARCDFDDIECIAVDSSQLEHLMMPMAPVHVHHA